MTRALLSLVAILVPASERDSWRREWDAEFAFAAQRQARGGTTAPASWRAQRVGSALRHAWWLRRQTVRLDSFGQDLRHAARTLVHRPAFTFAAVLTLAIGVGGTTVMFGACRAVLWRSLPFPDPDRLVMVSVASETTPDAASPNSVSPPDFADWRRQGTTFSAMAAMRDDSVALTGGDVPEQLQGAAVTADFFPMMGVPAADGRTLVAADTNAGAADVAVISDTLWRQRFGADPAVVGRSIVLDGVPTQVVGIMPATFAYPIGASLWTPLRFTAEDLTTQRGAHYLTAIARVRPGATIATAQAEMSAVSVQLGRAYPGYDQHATISVVALRQAIVGEDARPAMRVLFGAVAIVFLVACVNVASLVMGVTLGRRRELALRAALGASRGRLVRGLFVESMLLAVVGGLGGVGLAWIGTRAVAALEAIDIPLLDQTRVDWPVVVFMMAMTTLAAVLFGTLPAILASRDGVAETAGAASARVTSDRDRVRMRSALVAGEIGLAAALLVGAGLVGRSFLALTRVDLGFDPDHVQTVSLSLPAAAYGSADRRALVVQDLLATVSARVDVGAAGAIFGVPLSSFDYFMTTSEIDGAQVSGHEAQRLSLELRAVTPGYFRAMGIPLVGGRDFTNADRHGTAPVVIVNESAATLLWPHGRALGHHVTTGGRLVRGGDRTGGDVVGIVGDVHDAGPASRARPTIYAAHAQAPTDFVTLVVRPRGSGDDLGNLVGGIRRAMADLDPRVPVFRVRTMAQFLSRSVALPRLYLALLGLFAAIAIALAAVGIYGVMAQNVGARTREIGIRLALGATPLGVVGLVVRQAAWLTGAGVAAGLLLALVSRSALAGLLFGVHPVDGLTYVVVGTATCGVALGTAWLPARRAARVDPILTLRAE